MGCCGGGGDPAKLARQEEAARQARISEGLASIDTAFKGFNSPFYDARKQAYLAFALPTLGDQYQEQRKGLTYQLARQGLLHSSSAEQGVRALEKATGTAKQQIVDEASQQEKQLRMDVEGQRSQLVNQLNATSDPSIAQQQSYAAASNLRLPSAFAPVGQLFQTFAQQYVNKKLGDVYNQGGFTLGQRSPSSGAIPGVARYN